MAGLTRSEFQVRVLKHEGRMPEDIARDLNMKTPTFRSHLRSIHQKIAVSGQVDQMRRLNGAVIAWATAASATSRSAWALSLAQFPKVERKPWVVKDLTPVRSKSLRSTISLMGVD